MPVVQAIFHPEKRTKNKTLKKSLKTNILYNIVLLLKFHMNQDKVLVVDNNLHDDHYNQDD